MFPTTKVILYVYTPDVENTNTPALSDLYQYCICDSKITNTYKCIRYHLLPIVCTGEKACLS